MPCGADLAPPPSLEQGELGEEKAPSAKTRSPLHCACTEPHWWRRPCRCTCTRPARRPVALGTTRDLFDLVEPHVRLCVYAPGEDPSAYDELEVTVAGAAGKGRERDAKAC